MKSDKTARILRRIGERIALASSPSKASVKKDLMHLRWAMAGNRSSYRYLVSRFLRKSSDMDLLRQIDQVFSNAGVYPPVMKKDPGSGYYTGEIGDGITLAVKIEGDKFADINVNGQRVKDLNEAVEVYSHMKAGPSTEESGASRDADPTTTKCDTCGKEFSTDEEPGSYGECPHCGSEHTQCPGCEGWYEMSKNTDDHCPLCGYSSWGDEEEEDEEEDEEDASG